MFRKSDRFLYITLGSVIIIIAAFVIIMWQIGLFNFSGTESSATVIGAALALVGTLVAAVIGFVGTILKQSLDQQAEQRMKLEAAVRTLQLFSTSEGKETTEIQRDGALFALTDLGQHELTLQLADELVNKGQLSAGTASILVDHAILEGNKNVKAYAINLLKNHPLEIGIPNCVSNWVSGLPLYVREWATIAISKKILASPLKEWISNNLGVLLGLIVPLCLAWEKEKDPRLKKNTGAILQAILKGLPKITAIFYPKKDIDLNKIRREVTGCIPNSSEVEKVVENLNNWALSKEKQEDKKDTDKN